MKNKTPVTTLNASDSGNGLVVERKADPCNGANPG
jgi:hypothetical protein